MSGAVYDTRQWLPVVAPLVNGPGNRDPTLLRAVVAQFDVLHNPRYLKVVRAGAPTTTWCNIFLADVLLAMKTGEWLHWVEVERSDIGGVDKSHAGEPVPLFPTGPRDLTAPAIKKVELNANALSKWFNQYGPNLGWTEVDRDFAGAGASRGWPVAVTWINPSGAAGHVAILLPPLGTQLRIAQAGASNLFDVPLEQGFGNLTPRFFSHP